MFDFEKLDVHRKATEFSLELRKDLLLTKIFDKVCTDQIRRASVSTLLNIAEGSSRFSNADKRYFYIIARGSTVECVAIIHLLWKEGTIKDNLYLKFYAIGEEISKMLYSMINQLELKK